jgi:hypothetical protein
MSLNQKLHAAVRLLDHLPPEDRSDLQRICHAIRQAQAELLARAAHAMQRCLHNCGGLCCRNTQIDAIISHWDFVFILGLDPAWQAAMAACIADEAPYFTADCLFLKTQGGPCIFPSDVRPEVCITTFCSDTAAIREELRRVQRAFRRLRRFMLFRRLRALGRRLAQRRAAQRSRPAA